MEYRVNHLVVRVQEHVRLSLALALDLVEAAGVAQLIIFSARPAAVPEEEAGARLLLDAGIVGIQHKKVLQFFAAYIFCSV